jgi:hypothetical protein
MGARRRIEAAVGRWRVVTVSWKKTLLVVAAVVAVSGCSYIEAGRQADVAYKAQRRLLGLTEADVRGCAGPPVREQHIGDRSFLAYVSTPDATLGVPACMATFTFRDDELTDLQYTTHNGDMIKKREDCYQIIEGCMESEQIRKEHMAEGGGLF